MEQIKEFKLELIKQLDKQGYKHKEKIIEDEEYMIITNSISSCAIQIYDDICSLYEIVYDFSMNRYFLMYRNSKKIDDIESIFIGINFLINEINLNSLKKVYGLKKVKNKNLKRIKRIIKNSGFEVFDFIEKEEHLLISNNNKKWISINYKNNEFVYSYVYVMSSNEVSIGSSENRKECFLNYIKKMLENSYEKNLTIYQEAEIYKFKMEKNINIIIDKDIIRIYEETGYIYEVLVKVIDDCKCNDRRFIFEKEDIIYNKNRSSIVDEKVVCNKCKKVVAIIKENPKKIYVESNNSIKIVTDIKNCDCESKK